MVTLGPMMEESLRQVARDVARHFAIFITRPLSAALLLGAAAVLAGAALRLAPKQLREA